MTEAKLDKAFSLWIRLRDSDDTGHCKCVTCGKIMHYRDAHCGHFISRRHKATRWNEQNCSSQCPYCNTYCQGKQFEFSREIDRRYGKGTADKLLVMSKATSKIGKFEIDHLSKYYKSKAEELKRMKI